MQRVHVPMMVVHKAPVWRKQPHAHGVACRHQGYFREATPDAASCRQLAGSLLNRRDEGFKAFRVVLIENAYKASHIRDRVQAEIFELDGQRRANVNVVGHSVLSIKQAHRRYARLLGTVAAPLLNRWGEMGNSNLGLALLRPLPHNVVVGANSVLRISSHQDPAFLEDEDLIARCSDLIKVMRDDEQRLPGPPERFETVQTFLLKPRITHCQQLVDNEKIRIKVRDGGKG